ncbi:hypothetical protein PG989_012138 [Apiospora arundinis]
MERLRQFPHLSPEEQQAVLNGPAMTPPAGVHPDFSKPGNRPALAIGVSATCFSLATLFLLLRIYSRFVLVKKRRVEDSHIFFPEGSHHPQRRMFLWCARILMCLNILLYGSGIVAELLACIPLSAIWEPWVTGKCINKKALDISTAYFNFAMDIFILLMPQPIIWKLQMTPKKKIGVTMVCAIGRVYANHELRYVNEGGDTNYGLASLYLWSFAELACVMLVFCM